MNFDLSNRTYLVVGASSGIGRAIAVAISKNNGRVVLTSRNEENLKRTSELMYGDGHVIIPYDISNVDGIKNFVKKSIEKVAGKFDGLIFVAGKDRLMPIRSERLDSIRSFNELLYISYIALLKEFSSKRVLNNFGSIIAISSRAALFPGKGDLTYATAKSAMNTSSIVAAQELASRKIRVNTICPEIVKTPLTRGFFEKITNEQLENIYPLGYLEPEDVANTVLFLLSDMSRKITGQNIYLSAGNTGSVIDAYKLIDRS